MDLRLLFGGLIFTAVALLIAGIYLSWHSNKSPEAERVARRLRNVMGSEGSELAVSITKERLLARDPKLHVFLQRLPGVSALDRLLLQSGRSWYVARLTAFILAAALAGWIVAAIVSLPWWLQPLMIAAFAALPVAEVARAKAKRLLKVEQQLPDALDMMGRAMRAGHAFPTALKMVADEMGAPIAGEFRMVFDEVNFGVAMPTALMNMAQRVPSTDLHYFVVAVLIQRETGGNLTELLTSISKIIRDRIKLLGQVRVMSAEGKMSAWVLGGLPFAVGIMMYISNPAFLMLLFTDPTGRKMVGIAAVLMVLGFFAIRKISRIRV
jgi:tight adherence protein B